MNILISLVAVFAMLVIAEAWWRHSETHGEFSRKLVHITVGSFVAFWPFWLSWNQILLLSLAFLVVVLASKRLHFFKAIHSVQRPTWGELYFALAVGLLTLVTHDKWVYAAALLQMSLADGLAAVLGVRYGNGQSYLMFGHKKSLVGTATFFVISLTSLLVLNQWTDHPVTTLMAVGVALGAAAIENVAVKGLDNLVVPIFVAALLLV